MDKTVFLYWCFSVLVVSFDLCYLLLDNMNNVLHSSVKKCTLWGLAPRKSLALNKQEPQVNEEWYY